jgi:hypothetical protein
MEDKKMESYRIMTFEEAIKKAQKEVKDFYKLSSWAEKLYKNNGNKILITEIKPHLFLEDGIKKRGFDLKDIFLYFDLRDLTSRERKEIFEDKKLVFFEEINDIDKNNNFLFNF